MLIDEAEVASVLPGEYARFARPVCDGLAVFLEGLAPARQAEILEEQAALAPTVGISERLAVLARRCPALHKLGQILARDQRLAPELRRHLRELESLPPTTSQTAIEGVLAREFGSLESLGVSLAPQALAEASVAVVIPFTTPGPDGAPCDGVFKILKPGIEERLAEELELLGRVGAHLDERCHELGIPQLDYGETFDTVREKLQFEVRLDLEQRHLTQAQACFAEAPQVLIPQLFDFCTPRVTAMERVWGGKVTDHRFRSPAERRQTADLVIDALIGQPLFSRANEALFHSDPHAGNLLLTPDGRLAILDWSLVGVLGETERATLVQVLVSAALLDGERIASLLLSLAQRGATNPAALHAVIHDWLRRVRRGQLPGLQWMVGLLDEAVQTARLRLAPDLLLFRKSLHTLEGVVADLEVDPARMDIALQSEFLARLAVEWPWRWLAPPCSRQFRTRLSNADLARAVLNLPAAATRFWVGHGFDLVRGLRANIGLCV